MRQRITSRLMLVLLVLGLSGAAQAGNLGPDDRQISFTGLPGTPESDAVTPAIAYDDINQRFLSVWSADETDGDFQIYGQLLSGAAGSSIGNAFVIGATGLPGSDNRQPAIAFDATNQRYLVVWSSDAAVPGAYEIIGQAIGTDGQLIGTNHRYSDMGTNDGDTTFDAVTPDLVWHPSLESFVVVWAGDDDTGDLSDGRIELYGQLVKGTDAIEVGTNDFRISFAGPDADGNDATNPAIAITDEPERWYVAFEGDVTDDGIHDPEVLIYGGTGDTPDGAAFLVSQMGTGFSDGLSARNPDLAWVPSRSELICIWDGENGGGTPRAIYGQRALTDGTLVDGVLNLSGSAPPVTGPMREAIEPAITINPITNAWFVTWRGDLGEGLVQYDHEIWASRFGDLGGAIDTNAFSLSGMDPAADPIAGARAPAVATNTTHGYQLVIWSGDRHVTLGGEHEIFAQGWADHNASGAEDTPTVAAFHLYGAAPNPFNPATTIAFDLPAAAPVSLHIYDTAGRLVRTLLSEVPSASGRNEVLWNGRDQAGRQAASGVYLYRLETPRQQDMGRMTLVK